MDYMTNHKLFYELKAITNMSREELLVKIKNIHPFTIEQVHEYYLKFNKFPNETDVGLLKTFGFRLVIESIKMRTQQLTAHVTDEVRTPKEVECIAKIESLNNQISTLEREIEKQRNFEICYTLRKNLEQLKEKLEIYEWFIN